MDELHAGSSATVQQTVERIVKLLDAQGSMSSEHVVAQLSSSGIDDTTASTAVAYALQHGDLVLDWSFQVSRPEAQHA